MQRLDKMLLKGIFNFSQSTGWDIFSAPPFLKIDGYFPSEVFSFLTTASHGPLAFLLISVWFYLHPLVLSLAQFLFPSRASWYQPQLSSFLYFCPWTSVPSPPCLPIVTCKGSCAFANSPAIWQGNGAAKNECISKPGANVSPNQPWGVGLMTGLVIMMSEQWIWIPVT